MGKLRKRDGVWYADWIDLQGNRHRKSTRTRSEKVARQKLREWELADSVHRPDPFTVGDALALAGAKQVRRGNTAKTIQAALKRAEHVARILGERTDLHDVNLGTLGDTYIDARRKETTHKRKPPEDETVKKELLVLTQGMREGKRLGRFHGEPRDALPEALNECGNEGDRWLPQDEYAALREQATPYRRDWLDMYVLTGVDVGELHKVRKREDVNLERGEFGALHICADRTQGRKTKYRDRWVPLTAETREIVDRRLQLPGPMLFSPVWRSQHVAQRMKVWCPKAGIEPVIIKDLRRTLCSWMCQAGVPEFHVIRLMGHGSSEMVRNVYAQLDDSSFEHAIAALPTVTHMGQAEVIPIGIHREKQRHEKDEKAENA